MGDMFEYIDEVNRSNIITNYMVDDSVIRIKTADNKEIVINKSDSYIELLNGIISTQQKYQSIEKKKDIILNENFNKKARIVMSIIMFMSISMLLLAPNFISSLFVLVSLILLASSWVTHLNNRKELKKIDSILNNKKTVIIGNEYVLHDIKEKVQNKSEQKEEVLYLDDEL